MASGVPVVHPDRAAFSEIVRRTGGGLLVAKDNPDALADGLFTVLTDRQQAVELSRAAAEGVRNHYTVEAMAVAAEHVYREMRRSNVGVRK